MRWPNSDLLGDTWEDKASLQERFPLAEACGQASTQEEGDVNAPDQPGPQASNNSDRVAHAPQSTRPKKPNPRIFGPTWAN